MGDANELRIAALEDYLGICIYGYDLNGKPLYRPRIPPVSIGREMKSA